MTRIELEFITDQLGEERIDEFRRFLARDPETALCPYFDEAAWGCGIYEHRPFSCRVFGHYRQETTSLPQVCVFRGQEKIFGAGAYYQAVPQAAELKDLVRRFWPLARSWKIPEGPMGPDTLPSDMADGDALDRALTLQARGSLSEALRELDQSDLERSPYFLYVMGLVLEGMGRYEDAVQALREGLDDAPESATLWFRYGCNLYALGLCDSAESAFRETVALQEGHASAHGMLGAHLLRIRRASEAMRHLRRARELEPDNPVFGRLLENAIRAGKTVSS